MIHKYLRAVGFSHVTNRQQIQELISDAVKDATIRKIVRRQDAYAFGMFQKDYAPGIGIAVCGEYDDNDTFLFDYYFPYLKSDGISTAEDISLERLAAQEAYTGIVDEARVGVSLIFFMRNLTDYMERGREKDHALHGATLTLSALSDGGTIMLPIMKSRKDQDMTRKKSVKRYKMIAAAKRGNESAIESLTLEDMDTYTAVSKKIQESDVFTLVDTYFMPYGVECDHYSVLGEIRTCRRVLNSMTGESVYILKLLCNDMYFDVCINAADLVGEPLSGRRFKGNIWMQGQVNFTDSA